MPLARPPHSRPHPEYSRPYNSRESPPGDPTLEPAVRLSGVARDQTIPIQRRDFGDEGFSFEREEVDHAAARKRTDRDGVDDENDLLLRQPDHQIGIRVIEAEIKQLDRGAAELDGFLVVYRLIRQQCVRVLERSQMLLDLLVRNDCGTGVLERLAAGD